MIENIEKIVEILNNGGVVAYVTDTVWGLGALPENFAGVKKIYDIKKREPQKPLISFDDFQKCDIRTATILEAEKVAKTTKLLKLTVDTGIDKRTLVSGIAEHYDPKEIIGRKILMIVNLEPRKIKGIESKGMILCAEDAEGKLSLVVPEREIPAGAEIC